MRLLLNAVRWVLFVVDAPPLPEPGSCAARITFSGEESRS